MATVRRFKARFWTWWTQPNLLDGVDEMLNRASLDNVAQHWINSRGRRF